MPDSIHFLSFDDVVAIHEDTIAKEGGAAGLRNSGLLDSAVMMAQQQFGRQYLHDGLAAMAAAYLFHTVSNHAFLDGNKRAGAMAALVFLDVNGVEKLPAAKELERMTIDVATGAVTKEALMRWMEERVEE